MLFSERSHALDFLAFYRCGQQNCVQGGAGMAYLVLCSGSNNICPEAADHLYLHNNGSLRHCDARKRRERETFLILVC